MTKYDKRHGGPYDRGSADAYYGRPRRPHFFKGATYQSEEVTIERMLDDQLEAYDAGYNDQVASGDFKDYR